MSSRIGVNWDKFEDVLAAWLDNEKVDRELKLLENLDWSKISESTLLDVFANDQVKRKQVLDFLLFLSGFALKFHCPNLANLTIRIFSLIVLASRRTRLILTIPNEPWMLLSICSVNEAITFNKHNFDLVIGRDELLSLNIAKIDILTPDAKELINFNLSKGRPAKSIQSELSKASIDAMRSAHSVSRGEPNTKVFREFLTAFFSDEEIDALCFDRFSTVFDQLSAMTKTKKIQCLLEHCKNHSEFLKLKLALAEERPEQYKQREHTFFNSNFSSNNRN
ncbi:MAG: hypothetical protein KF716_12405 [Anaerolineae bacterium]|nr:hypothetical protein [Anaerolineae bacterium]